MVLYTVIAARPARDFRSRKSDPWSLKRDIMALCVTSWLEHSGRYGGKEYTTIISSLVIFLRPVG